MWYTDNNYSINDLNFLWVSSFQSNISANMGKSKELSKDIKNKIVKTINKKFGEKVTSFAVIIWKCKEYKMTVDRPRSEDLASQG